MYLLKKLIEIPEDRYCCKYCYYCSCSEDSHGGAYCHNDIGEYVNVDTDYCCEFAYDPNFERT